MRVDPDAPLFDGDPARRSVFLERVQLHNYRSIARCDVELGPLTFLVGPNGSGKSNFLDALRLVADALNNTLEQALLQRGGIAEVRRRSTGHPTHFQLALRMRLKDGFAKYSFKVGAERNGGFSVSDEVCEVTIGKESARFEVKSGEVAATSLRTPMPPAARDRLYLVNVSGYPEFLPVYHALSRMGFHNLNPNAIRALQTPSPGEILQWDGANLASVVRTLQNEAPESHRRIVEYLAAVTEGIEDIEYRQVFNKETLDFRQRVGANASPWHFSAGNMSDGTLRALGILVALFQSAGSRGRAARFVGIEEPETALHPGAAAVLRDALQEASGFTQIAVTSHSPELLDAPDIVPEQVLAVRNTGGVSHIQPLGAVGKQAVRDKLTTVGELLRTNQLMADLDTTTAPA